MSTAVKKKPTSAPARPSGPRPLTYKVTLRDAADAVSRLRSDHKGGRYVNRFSAAVVTEHFIFMLAVIVLGLTGFSQTFYNTLPGSAVLALFGGIDAVRVVHHAFAYILAIVSVYHILRYLNELIVYRRAGGMWFEKIDWQMLFRFGKSDKPARYGRYTFPEKVSYWVIAFCILVLGATGIVQGYPIFASKYLPGVIIPVARVFHRWEAILCVAAVLVWHLYDVVFRKFNVSVFTGNMSLKNMEEDHPLELQYLEKAAAAIHSEAWPVTISIPQGEELVKASPVVTPETGKPVEGPKEAAPESPKEVLHEETPQAETPAKEEK